MYEKIKRFYDLGLYSKAQVEKFFQHGYLTQEQYEAIVGGGEP